MQRVLRFGQAALLRGDGRAACHELTARGKRRSLGFAEDFDGQDPSTPLLSITACEQVVAAEHRYNARAWIRDVRGAHFALRRRAGDEATVEVLSRSGYALTDLRLLKIHGVWRIDDCPLADHLHYPGPHPKRPPALHPTV